MQATSRRPDAKVLKRKLQRVRLASAAAIELGDCRAVALLTCHAARLQDALSSVERR